jgi:hypothetical protein
MKHLLCPVASIARILVPLIVAINFCGAQTPVPISIKDMPDQRIRLIPAGSPEFDDRLSELLGTGPDSKEPAFLAQKPFSVILENGSGRTLLGYSLRWTKIDSDGKRTTADVLFTILSGDKEAQVGPSGVAWVTPRRVITHGGDHLVPPQARDAALAAMQKLARMSAITISLDAVIYDDGTLVGANATRAFEQATALATEDRLLAQEFLNRHAMGQDEGQITPWLRAVVAAPNPNLSAGGIDTIDWSYAYRRNYAQLLLACLGSGGLESGSNLAGHTLDRKIVQIRR